MTPRFSGPALRKAREAAGLTLHELEMATIARHRRVPKETLQRWETDPDGANPRSEELALVAELVGIPLTSLFVKE